MAERTKHLFHFVAIKIAKAANNEAAYHETRLAFWKDELAKAMEQLKQTAKLEFKEVQVTGGSRLELSINYGDLGAYSRMQEAQHKIERHRTDAARFRSDQTVYGSQDDRIYELDAEDVHHFRLGGKPREE